MKKVRNAQKFKDNEKLVMKEVFLDNWENYKYEFSLIGEILREDTTYEEFFLDLDVFNKTDEEFWKESKEKFSKELYEYTPRFFIFSNKNNGNLGFITLIPDSFIDGKVKYSIGVKRNHRKQGYGLEMLKLFFDKIESIKWIYKINSLVFGWNIASQKLHRRLVEYLRKEKPEWDFNQSIRKKEIVFKEEREDLIWYEFFYIPRE